LSLTDIALGRDYTNSQVTRATANAVAEPQ
jgi:hypothetical protein